MNIRSVVAEDSDELLRWRNDCATRAMSLNSEVIDARSHAVWFSRLLANEHRISLIGTVESRPVGWVRFDPRNVADEYLVSITVAPEMRSKGMGSKLLALGIVYIRSKHPQSTICAQIKVSNSASLKVFERHGFRLLEDEGSLQTLILTPSKP